MATPIWPIEGVALDSTGDMVAGSLADVLTDVGTAVAALGGIPDITPVEGTFSFDETSAAEQTVFTLTITERTKINAIWLNGENITQEITDLYLYYRINGVDYAVAALDDWDPSGAPPIALEVLVYKFTVASPLVVMDNVRLTFTCDGLGGDYVDVPYQVL